MRFRASLLLAAVVATSAAAQETPPAKPRRFHFGGFANATIEHSLRGEVDLYAIDMLSDEVSLIGEGFIQHGTDLDVDHKSTKRVELDLERLYAAYNPSDRFRLEVGINHTGIIRWNEREHRGRFLQTPIDVPAIALREEQGGAWPLHFGGVWVSGRLAGPLGVQYGAGVGKARGSRRDEIQPLFDRESSISQLASLSIAPDALPGWQLGGSEYGGDIPAPDGAMREVDYSLFTAYVHGGAELRAEWAEMHHTRVGGDGRRFTSHGWFALASWRPRGRWEVLRPYVLVDMLDVAVGEPYLRDVNDQRAMAVGLRWDARRRLAVKTDVRDQLAPGGGRERLLRLQVAISF